jgi:hypothetical protein
MVRTVTRPFSPGRVTRDREHARDDHEDDAPGEQEPSAPLRACSGR